MPSSCAAARRNCCFVQPRGAPAVQLDQLGVHLLALTDLGNVNKIRDRLAVEHRRAARDDERGQLRALARVERHARQIEHIQHGGKRHLVADGKGDDVKIADGIAGLERIERQPARRISSSMSPQGAKTRSHQTPSMLFIMP